MGLVTLAGASTASGQRLLRYVASELALERGSDDVDVILAGFNNREAWLLVSLNPDRVRSVGSIAEAASRMSRRASAATTTLENVAFLDALAGRILDVAADAWMPADPAGRRPGPRRRRTVAGPRDRAGRQRTPAPWAWWSPPKRTARASGTDHHGRRRGHAVAAAIPAAVPAHGRRQPSGERPRTVGGHHAIGARRHRDSGAASAGTGRSARGTDAAGGILSVFEGLAEPTQEIAVPRYEEHDDMRDDTGREQVYPMNSGQRYSCGQRPARRPPRVRRVPRGVDPVVRTGSGRPRGGGRTTVPLTSSPPSSPRSGRTTPSWMIDLRAWREADPSRPCIGHPGVGRGAGARPGTEHQPSLPRRDHRVPLAQQAGRGADLDSVRGGALLGRIGR